MTLAVPISNMAEIWPACIGKILDIKFLNKRIKLIFFFEKIQKR